MRLLWTLLAALPLLAADPARAVADKLLATKPESFVFDWGEGVQMHGLLEYAALSGETKYVDYVARWADFHAARGAEVLMGNEPGSKRRGFCGTWICGTVLWDLDQKRKNARWRGVADAMRDYIRAGATRSPEGALGHWEGNFQLWVDTVHMASPLLSRYGVYDDAARQLLVFAKHLREPKSGLFYHMYDWQVEKPNGITWGRGNGWIILALAETLERMPKTHADRAALEKLAREFAAALLKLQNRDGVWHTVMDDATSPEECSATTMFAGGMMKLARIGVLPASYRAPARKAWDAVNRKWVKDGVVVGVSAGTVPADKATYAARPLGTYTWGTGAYLYLAAEMLRLEKK